MLLFYWHHRQTTHNLHAQDSKERKADAIAQFCVENLEVYPSFPYAIWLPWACVSTASCLPVIVFKQAYARQQTLTSIPLNS